VPVHSNLPFTVLRRLDCFLEATKTDVLTEKEKREAAGLNPEPFLLKKSGQLFYNTSPLDLKRLMGDQDHIGENLRSYLRGFSPAVRDIFESFDFHTQIDKLDKASLLYLVTEKSANIDLHPETIDDAQMGAVFEELIRKFAELSNETAREHFTPRDAIRLMVNLLFIEDDDVLTKPGVVRSLYDRSAPAAWSAWPRTTFSVSTPTPASSCTGRSSTPSPTRSARPTCSSKGRTSPTSSSATPSPPTG